MESKKILDVRIDFGISVEDAVDIMEKDFLNDEKNHVVCTTNPEFVVDAQKDEEFKDIINNSSLSTPDGVGVIYAKDYLDKIAKFRTCFLFPIRAFMYGLWLGLLTFIRKNKKSNERVTGVDLTYKICERSAKKGYSIFFLGGRAKNALGNFTSEVDNDMSTAAANVIKNKYPGVNIVGSTSQFSREPKDDEKTIEYIKKCMEEKDIQRIDFLFVAYNHMNQEKWIMRNKDKIPAKVSMGCGGTFDYIVGNYSLPPTFYIKKDLGWLYRLIKQPWRFKRIIKAFPIFPMKIFLRSIKDNCQKKIL